MYNVTAPSNLPSSGKHKNNNFQQKSVKFCQITCMTSILMLRNFETLGVGIKKMEKKDESGE